MILKSILYMIQGAIVGIGAIIPGVSGGVLCVAFGIYEPIMALLTHPIKSFKKYYLILLPFLIGWVLGFVYFAKGVELFLELAPEIALMLFFGLICGTIPELLHTSEVSGSNKSWTSFVLALALAYLLFHILEQEGAAILAPSFLTYVLSGFLWGLSLIIPGLSSSSILIFLDLYEPLTAGIGMLNFYVIVPFLIGITFTVMLFARLVTMLFEKYYTFISRIILGIMIASALKILPQSFASPMIFFISLICFMGGFFAAQMMDYAKRDHQMQQNTKFENNDN